MAVEPKIVKGYVKTVSLIWMVSLALLAGFTGGIVFSAYRNNALMPNGLTQETAAPALSAQQQESLRALLKKTQADPKDVAAWTQLADLYFDSGQSDLAISAYERSLALDGSRPDVWTDLGVMYRRAGNPQKAIEAFDHAISIDPRHRIALFNKGVVMMHDLKDPQGALSAWEKLVSIDPQAKTPSGQPVKELVDALKKENAS
ncbi:MAG: tetratricopeptide repeat protein [Desulfosarcinaceae bacterium]